VRTKLTRASRQYSAQCRNTSRYSCTLPFCFFLPPLSLSPARLVGLLYAGPFLLLLTAPGIPLCLLGLAPLTGFFLLSLP
jgi:hypothetical protein